MPVLLGTICTGGGLVLLAFAGEHQAYVPLIAVTVALIGIGPGLAFMPLLVTGMSRVSPADAGLASGIINTSLQISAAIGIAVFGTLATNRSRADLHQGVRPTAALLSGYHLAFWVGAGVTAAALAAALAWVHRDRPARTPAVSPGAKGDPHCQQPLETTSEKPAEP